jgi:hypothetical protein
MHKENKELRHEIMQMKIKQKDNEEKAAKVCDVAGQLKEARKTLKTELSIYKEKFEIQVKLNKDQEQ